MSLTRVSSSSLRIINMKNMTPTPRFSEVLYTTLPFDFEREKTHLEAFVAKMKEMFELNEEPRNGTERA